MLKILALYFCFYSSLNRHFVKCDSFVNDGNISHDGSKATEKESYHGRELSLNDNRSSIETNDRRNLQDLPYEIISVLPHDEKSFTQGLSYYNGVLYEGTGLHGQSRLRKIDPTTGEYFF